MEHLKIISRKVTVGTQNNMLSSENYFNMNINKQKKK